MEPTRSALWHVSSLSFLYFLCPGKILTPVFAFVVCPLKSFGVCRKIPFFPAWGESPGSRWKSTAKIRRCAFYAALFHSYPSREHAVADDKAIGGRWALSLGLSVKFSRALGGIVKGTRLVFRALSLPERKCSLGRLPASRLGSLIAAWSSLNARLVVSCARSCRVSPLPLSAIFHALACSRRTSNALSADLSLATDFALGSQVAGRRRIRRRLLPGKGSGMRRLDLLRKRTDAHEVPASAAYRTRPLDAAPQFSFYAVASRHSVSIGVLFAHRN